MASFSILADMVEVVGGDHVTVTSIVGPDSDAHVYSPSVGDARAVAAADIIFVNGLGFEGWISDLVVAAEASAPVIVATQAVTPQIVEGEADPHAWNALDNAKLYAASMVKPGDRHRIAPGNDNAAFRAEVDDLLADASAAFRPSPKADAGDHRSRCLRLLEHSSGCASPTRRSTSRAIDASWRR